MPVSTEDRFSRGLRDAVFVLGGMVLSGVAFGSAVEALGWLTGVVEPPAVVRIYRRGTDDLVLYSAGLAWRLLLVYLFSGVLFAAGTVIAAILTVGIFRRAARKARLARQRKRHAGPNFRVEDDHPGSWPEPKNDPPLQRTAQPFAIPSRDARPGSWLEPKNEPPPQRTTQPYAITSRDARTRGRLQVEVPLELVAEAVCRAGEHLSRFTLVELSSNRALFTAPMNWKTWGLWITLTFTRDDLGGTIIDALAEPQVEYTLVDYGQGKNDIRALLRFIEVEVSNPRSSSVWGG
jgi:hypothetical protein